MTEPKREYNLVVLGSPEIGKTSLCQTLTGKPFARKTYHHSTEEEPKRYSMEVNTKEDGLLLFHLWDWAWYEKQKVNGSINNELKFGKDGCIFMYDVTNRKSLSDLNEFSDWYQRAAGFEKPVVVVSNKNEQKKKSVQDTEGAALSRRAAHRVFCPISLVENTGVEEFVLSMVRLITSDAGVEMLSHSPASEASLLWSAARQQIQMNTLGQRDNLIKCKRVLLMAMNSAVIQKFTDNFAPSQYVLEAAGSVAEIEEYLRSYFASRAATDAGEWAATTASAAATSSADDAVAAEVELPIVAVVAPPTITEGQQKALTALADQYGCKFVLSIPKGVVEAVIVADTA